MHAEYGRNSREKKKKDQKSKNREKTVLVLKII